MLWLSNTEINVPITLSILSIGKTIKTGLVILVFVNAFIVSSSVFNLLITFAIFWLYLYEFVIVKKPFWGTQSLVDSLFEL